MDNPNNRSNHIIQGTKITRETESYVAYTYATISQFIMGGNKTDDNILFSQFQNININTKNGSIIRKTCLLIGYKDGFALWDLSQHYTKSHEVSLLFSCPTEYPVYIVKIIDDNTVFNGITFIIVQQTRKSHLVTLYSLENNCKLKEMEFPERISDIQTKNSFIAIGFKHSHTVKIIDLKKNEERTLKCWKSELASDGPVFALGSRFIAYQPRVLSQCFPPLKAKKDSQKESQKQFDIKEAILNVKDTINKNLNTNDVKKFANMALKEVIYNSSHLAKVLGYMYTEGDYHFTSQSSTKPGYVEIIDLKSNFVKNFKAYSKSIVYMKFDPSGCLLLTSPDGGQNVDIWPAFSQEINPVPFYNLDMGVMTRNLLDAHFNESSTIVSILTTNGTIHMYPILPNGGIIVSPQDHELKTVDFNDVKRNFSPIRISTISAKNVMSIMSYPYPLKRKWDTEKIACKKFDHCCLLFSKDGTLVKYNIEISQNDFKGKAYAHYSWDISNRIKFKEYTGYKNYHVKEGGSNIETVTHMLPKHGKMLDGFTIHVYKELPNKSGGYRDSEFEDTVKEVVEPKKKKEKYKYVEYFDSHDIENDDLLEPPEEVYDSDSDNEFLIKI